MHVFQYYMRAENLCLSSALHNMKKVVVKVPPVEDPKKRQKALKSVAGMEGVVHASVNTKDGLITVIGQTDPVAITRRLRKLGFSDLISVGPAKDEEKTKQPAPAPAPTPTPTPAPALAREPQIIYCPRPAEYCYWYCEEPSGAFSPCTIM